MGEQGVRTGQQGVECGAGDGGGGVLREQDKGRDKGSCAGAGCGGRV